MNRKACSTMKPCCSVFRKRTRAPSLVPAQAGAAPPSKKSKVPSSERVSFYATDGVSIVADFYAPKVKPGKQAPVAILVHMYPADRASWKPLIPHLIKVGCAVLAYDIRGHGESIEPAELKLQEKYDARDAGHFNGAWLDAEAARNYLMARPECDGMRVAMIGASIGCSISLHYGSQQEAVKAIVCLSPGTNYFGVDSIEHIKACGDRKILLVSPEGEYAAVSTLVEASGGAAKGKKYPGGSERHGTKMFEAEYGKKLMKKIARLVGSPCPPPSWPPR